MSHQGYVSSDEIAATPGRFLMCTRGSYGVTKLFDKIGADRVDLVWSLWRGYWDKPDCAMRKWAVRRGVQPHFVHSGGHAWPEDLDRLVKAIAPKHPRVWVHTDARDIQS